MKSGGILHSNRKSRPRWKRSVFLAGVLHALVLGYLVSHVTGINPFQDALVIDPALHGRIVEQRPAADLKIETPAQAVDASVADSPVEEVSTAGVAGLAIEPSGEYLRRAAQSLIAAAKTPAGPNAFRELERKARVIEQISSPAEISRISNAICAALGVRETAPPLPGASSAGFDYDRCVLLSSERIERVDRVEIRETLRDPAGRTVVLSYIRMTDDQAGEVEFVQTIHVSDRPDEEFEISEEEFTDAESRQRPYEVINRFALVRQIHDQAVLPILEKLSAPESPEEPHP